MRDEEIVKIYEGLLKLSEGKEAGHFCCAIGNVLAVIAYENNAPLMRVISAVNSTALETYTKLVEEEDESTKH